MFLRKEIIERLEKLKKLLEDENRQAVLLVTMEKRLTALEKQNERLFDKLMARDFQELMVYKEPEPGDEKDVEPIPEDADEANAGELLEITDEA